MASSQPDSTDHVSLAADIVAAYVVHNSIPTSALPELIQTVHAALVRLGAVTVAPEPETLVPKISIRRSITPDYLICLDDGRKFKSLKRHIASLGMTPEQYRAKWKLPSDYPMTALAYSTKRSELAKKLGLGRLR